jgi:hypothetical protein
VHQLWRYFGVVCGKSGDGVDVAGFVKQRVLGGFCSVSAVEPDGIEPSTSALPVLRPAQDSSRKQDSAARSSIVHQMCGSRVELCAAQSSSVGGGK